MAKLAALVPRPRTNLTGPPLCPWVQVRFQGVLAPNSRYRESVTPLSARQVKPATADVEADGPDESDLRAGRRKGLYGRPPRKEAQASVQRGRLGIDVSVCSVCGGPMRIIVGMPNHSIEEPMVIGKILSHLDARSCTPAASVSKVR